MTITAFYPGKTTTYLVYITCLVYNTRIIVPITTHTHVRLKSIGGKKRNKENKRKEVKGNESKEKKAKKERKEKDKKRKQGNETGRNVILADPRN